jgi:Flp pilus assembly protein TadD
MMTLTLALLLSSGAARSGEIEEPPSYTTDEGRRAVWRDLAKWYIDNRMPQQALDMVKRVRETGYNDDELVLIQAKALLAQGMTEESRNILEDLHRRRPRDPAVLGTLGIIYSDLGMYDQSVELLTTAATVAPDDAAIRNNLGFVLMGLGRCADAQEHLEAVLALDATNGRYRNNLAFALVCVGEHQRALKLFRSTLPEAEARFNMGLAYERLDSVPAAILQYREVLAIAPDHAAAKEALVRLGPSDTNPEPPTEGAP